MCLAALADGVWGSSVEEMFEANLDVARSLLRDGWTLQFFIFWPMHDRAITRKLVRALGDSDRVRVTVSATPADFFRVARTCSVFVGTRLHSAVFASMLDIPTVALAYRPKADDFMPRSAEPTGHCGRMESRVSDFATPWNNSVRSVSNTWRRFTSPFAVCKQPSVPMWRPRTPPCSHPTAHRNVRSRGFIPTPSPLALRSRTAF